MTLAIKNINFGKGAYVRKSLTKGSTVDSLRSMSISHKLLLILMFVSFFSIVPISGLFIYYDYAKAKSALINETKLITEYIGSKLTMRNDDANAKHAEKAINELSKKSGVKEICVFDAQKKLVASSTSIDKLGCTAPIGEGYFIEDNHLNYSAIIMDEQWLAGYVFIKTSLEPIDQKTQIFVSTIFCIVIALLAVIYLISTHLEWLITAPIVKLASIATEVKETNNYNLRSHHQNNDEIGKLHDAFNEMMERIKDRDNALLIAQQELEVGVIERTHELEIAKDEAEDAFKTKSLFLANMSHELRTPMHAILSFSKFALEDLKENNISDIEKYLNRIRESGERLLGLINNLLDLSKLEAGMMEMNFVPAQIEEIITPAMKELQPLMMNKNLKMLVNSNISEPNAVFDKEKMIQVFYNLLSNAMKFSPENGEIKIEIAEFTLPKKQQNHSERKAFMFSIEDEGLGIPDDELETIFEQFVQSSKTTNGAGGTGLGLAICRDIIEMHDGKIWAEPSRSKGAKFVAVVPFGIEAGKRKIKTKKNQ